MEERRFDDAEVGQILLRASEIQSDLVLGGSEGVTFDELERMASDVGLRPDVVKMATDELSVTSPVSSLGVADSINLERSVAGEIDEGGWESLVAEARKVVGKPGKSEQVGHSREWIGTLEIGFIMFNVSSRGGKTRIRLSASSSGATVLAWVIGMSVGFISTLVFTVMLAKAWPSMGSIGQLALGISVSTLWALAIHGFVKFYRRRFRKKVENLLDVLCGVAVDSRTVCEERTLQAQSETTLINSVAKEVV